MNAEDKRSLETYNTTSSTINYQPSTITFKPSKLYTLLINNSTDFPGSAIYDGSLHALGIAAASFASFCTGSECGNGNDDYEKGLVAGRSHGERRYSGKPDGIAGTPSL